MPPSCGEQVKLLRERQLLPAGIFRLLFTHHMDQLDATQDYAGTVSRFEAEHRSHAAFDGAVILLDAVIEVLTLPDPDRLQLAPRSVLQPALGITRQDGFPIGLTTVDDDPLRPAMPLERLAQKPFGSSEVAPLAEPELIRVLGLEEPGFISVSINDVVRGKPDPEPYERAATLMGLQPQQCIAIEDSPIGAQAALAAGTHLIAWPEDRMLEFPPGTRPITDLEPAVKELFQYAA